MVKTQIQLEEWQYAELKKESSRGERSMSDFIREAVTLALRRKTAMRPLKEIAGKYEPLPMEDLKTHDAAWARSIR